MFLLGLFVGVIIGAAAGFFLSALLRAGEDDRATAVQIAAANAMREKDKIIAELTENTIPKLEYTLARANKYGIAADKENKHLRAEVERLQKYNTDVAFKHYNDGINDFAKRLKKKETTAINCRRFEGVISTDEIDNLANEMRAKGEKQWQ